jgi:eukaryotic-like serine/threonine-protein kinase
MSLTSPLAEALRDRYVLERELGRGGMATVYLARDLKHDRSIALKVLHPELAATLGPERFQREIKLAARLQHPHVLSVHDSGEAAGQLWYTMPFVEGESLRDRMNRERQLPLGDALQITREVADALGYAHSHGVVHRDIKPENILLSRGHSLVADFGVARALQTAGERLTETGLSVGTPGYMSPEQSVADPSLDGRSDLYSLGCVLYEMLTGEAPYTGASPQAIIAKRLLDPVPSARRLRETVPSEVDRALQHVLAKTPADRFPTAEGFAQALLEASLTERVPLAHTGAGAAGQRSRMASLAVAGILFLAIGAALYWGRTYRGRSAAIATTGPTRLAVLPFENLGDTADAYFAEGVSDEIRGKLATLPGLEVIARTSSSGYRRTTKTPQQIARELGVEYLLTGTVRWEKKSPDASRVRVSPELVDANSGATRWQAPFDAALTDVFNMQAEIAIRVASALGGKLAGETPEHLTQSPTANLAAYDAYLKGMELYLGPTARLGGTERAIEFFEQAIALDSNFALAWASLSRASTSLYTGTPSSALASRARVASERALQLAPSEAASHLAAGGYLYFIRSDPKAALLQYEAGSAAAPGNADLIRQRGAAEMSLGQLDAAIQHFEQAAALDPRSRLVLNTLAYTRWTLRQFPQALKANARAIAIDSTSPENLLMRALIYASQGDLDAARASLAELPAGTDEVAVVTYVAAFGGWVWLLNDRQQEMLVRLRPAAFGNHRGLWAITLSFAYRLQGDSTRMRAYADTAEREYSADIRQDSTAVIPHMFHALALARLGRRDAAHREADAVRRLAPLTHDPRVNNAVNRGVAWIYATIGAKDAAIALLDSLLHVPSIISPGMLRLDPAWTPLRDNPRFQHLAASIPP